MTDYEAIARQRDIEDRRRGYSIGGFGGQIQEGRAITMPTIVESVTPAKADMPPDTRNVLIGRPLLYNQIIQHDGKYLFIRPGAFKDLNCGAEVFFQFNHDPAMRVASTKHHLTLHSDEFALNFKLYLPPTILGMKARNAVRDNVMQAMSAAFTTTKIEKHIVDGVEIILVKEAELHEISLVERGANDDAFAILVDDSAEWVTDMSKSFRLKDEMDRAHIGRLRRRLEAIS